MKYTDYMLYKAIALVVIVGIVNVVYTFVTGKTIEEARRDSEKAKQDRHEEH